MLRVQASPPALCSPCSCPALAPFLFWQDLAAAWHEQSSIIQSGSHRGDTSNHNPLSHPRKETALLWSKWLTFFLAWISRQLHVGRLSQNGLNDQLEGKKEFLSLKFKGPRWRALLPKRCLLGLVPSSLQGLTILYICLTIMNWVLILQENIGHFHYMQSSKKAAKCATPLILNRILPKCHCETRVWGYYKSEGIKTNFHLYKGFEGHDSCHTHTPLIGLNSICQFQCESPSPDLACPSGEISASCLLWGLRCARVHACAHTL